MGLDWRDGKLTLDNFSEFARDTIAELYLIALSVTVDMKRTEKLCVDALCHLFADRSLLAADENQITPHDAVRDALKPLLNRTERDRLDNPIFHLGRDRVPDDSVLSALVEQAVRRAKIEMPRYAPTFSGRRGTIYMLILIFAILAVIALVWIDPFSAVPDSASLPGGGGADVAPVFPLNPELLIHLEIVQADVSRGSVPVTVRISGPDDHAVTGVSAVRRDPSGETEIPSYNCNGEYYCFVAEESGQYAFTAMGDGESAVTYFIDVEAAPNEITLSRTYYVFPHDRSQTIDLSGAFGGIGSAAEVERQPKHGGIIKDEAADAYTYTPDTKFVGVDDFAITVSLSDGSKVTCELPIIVVNSPPSCDPESLTMEVYHSPSKSGTAVGKIEGIDPDEDALRYTLISTTGCEVMLAAGGGFAAHIDPDYVPKEETAPGFSFTISDGLLEAGPFDFTFALENKLADLPAQSQEFYCYSGPNGFYELPLPQFDEDGDPLSWNVTTPLSNGYTELGSEVTVNNGIIKYRLSQTLDQDTREVLTLSYTDGWSEAKTIEFTCMILKNPGPVADKGNFIEVPVDVDSGIVCEVRLVQHCPFSKYEITAIDSVEGGAVITRDGWQDLKFTFSFSQGYTSGKVVVTVQDTLTKQEAQIEYIISKQ